MLWTVQQTQTNLSYLNDVLAFFIIRSRHQSRYLKKRLFPSEFIKIHDSNGNNVREKFKAVFDEINKLDIKQRRSLICVYLNNQRVERLCLDKKFPRKNLSNFPTSLQAAIKKLGEYLYSSVLQQSCFTDLPNVNDTLREHWTNYKYANGRICCFCGINKYTEQLANVEARKQLRPAFDHYLPKEKYPFTSVNFNNLIPICDFCNGRRFKGSIDPCEYKKQTSTHAFYPFDNLAYGNLSYKVELNSNQIKGREEISDILDVELSKPKDEQHCTWNHVFKVVSRVKGHINECYGSWLQTDILTTSHNLAHLKTLLKDKGIANLQNRKNLESGFHKGYTYLMLSQLNDASLEAVLEAVGYLPVPGNDEELNDLLKSIDMV